MLGCRRNSAVAGFHVHATVTLVRVARGAVPRVPAEVRRIESLVLRGSALQLAKDGFLVVEEIAHQAIGVALMHGEGVFDAGTQDAGREGLREGGDEGFVRGGKFDEAGEVRRDGVEGGDVGEAQLAEGVLQNGDAGRGVGGGIGGRVDGLDDFVDLAGHYAVGEFEEVELEDRGDDGDFVALEDLAGDIFAGVDTVAEVMGGGEGNVDDPDAAASFVAFEVGVIWYRISTVNWHST